MKAKQRSIIRIVRGGLLMLALTVVLGVLPGIAYADDGNLSGDGSLQNPYIIKNYQDLKAFADLVNKNEDKRGACAVLENNIEAKYSPTDLDYASDWTPIGTSSAPYTGTFNGDGKTISGLTTPKEYGNCAGLFGCIGEGGKVSKVGLEEGHITGKQYVGSVAGALNSSANIMNCYNTGTVTGNDCAGGIAGWCGGTITDCYNTGTVTGNEHVGGVTGENTNSSFTNCYNTGTVTGNEHVGGVTGCFGSGRDATIKNCYNTGKISGSDTYNVGGVVGLTKEYANIKYCYNAGTVTGNYNVGGVAGHHTGKGLVENCYNTGAVSCWNNADTVNLGGVVGLLETNATATNCYNTGAVTGNHFLGGVAGYVDHGAAVTNCYSAGYTFGDTFSGGVVGENWGYVDNVYYDKSQTSVEKAVGRVNEGFGNTGENVGVLSTSQMTGTDAIGSGHIVFKYSGNAVSPWLVKPNETGTFYYPHLQGFDFAKDGQRVDFPMGITEDCPQMLAADIQTADWPAKFMLTKLTITVKDQTYPYNGQQQGEGDPTYNDPDVIKSKVDVAGLQGSDYLAVLTLTGSQTKVGEYPGCIQITGYDINNADGVSVKDHYIVTLVAGSLTITEKKPKPTTKPTTKPTSTTQPAAKAIKTPLTKATAKGDHSLTIAWAKVEGAAGYEVFFARCDGKGSATTKKVKTIKGNKTFTWTKSGLKKGTAYKAYVKAYAKKNGKKTYIGSSPVMHAYTAGASKKYTNAKSISVNKTKVKLKKGKTFKLKAKVKKLKKSKKLMPKTHVATVRYLSTDKKIATVSKKGKITAKGKGTCYVYAYAHNGVYKKVKVTVK